MLNPPALQTSAPDPPAAQAPPACGAQTLPPCQGCYAETAASHPHPLTLQVALACACTVYVCVCSATRSCGCADPPMEPALGAAIAIVSAAVVGAIEAGPRMGRADP